MYRHQTFFLQNAHLFPPEHRDWVVASREEWLRLTASDRELPLSVRTPVVTAWARALYHTGQTGRAESCLLAWHQRHGEAIRDGDFHSMLIAVPLFGRGDWEKAAEVRDAVNEIAESFSTPGDRRAYDRMLRRFYESMALPEYELRRRRAVQVREYHQKVKAADEQHRLQAREENQP